MEQLGPYQLVRQIAVGGMAEVYLAKTIGVAGFEKYVAVKRIHPRLAERTEFVHMLVDEAKIAVQLNHPNIAQTFDLGRDGDTYYLAMEYIDGIDLFQLLRAATTVGFLMPFDAVAFIAREIALALEHAHGKRDVMGVPLGVIHRDVAPDNVLISHEGAVKLCDFGIAKCAARATQTAIGVVKGKFHYMSPEQTCGAPLDSTTDIYSSGVVVYEMLTGRTLYDEHDMQRLLDMIQQGSFVAPSRLRGDVPPELERIVMKALAPRPHRYASAGEMAQDLQRFLHDYSPLFVSTTLGSLVGVVLDRIAMQFAQTRPPAPTRHQRSLTADVDDAVDSIVIRDVPPPIETEWCGATTPYQKKPVYASTGLKKRRLARGSRRLDEAIEFQVEDPSKQIQISFDVSPYGELVADEK